MRRLSAIPTDLRRTDDRSLGFIFAQVCPCGCLKSRFSGFFNRHEEGVAEQSDRLFLRRTQPERLTNATRWHPRLAVRTNERNQR